MSNRLISCLLGGKSSHLCVRGGEELEDDVLEVLEVDLGHRDEARVIAPAGPVQDGGRRGRGGGGGRGHGGGVRRRRRRRRPRQRRAGGGRRRRGEAARSGAGTRGRGGGTPAQSGEVGRGGLVGRAVHKVLLLLLLRRPELTLESLLHVLHPLLVQLDHLEPIRKETFFKYTINPILAQ